MGIGPSLAVASSILTASSLAVLGLRQDSEQPHATHGPSHDATPAIRSGEIVRIDIGEADAGIEGQRSCEVFHCRFDFEGDLYVWARSGDLDPELDITSIEGDPISSDGDSGGGTTASIRLRVQRGKQLMVHVASKRVGVTGRVELRFVAAPETPEKRAAAESALQALDDADRAARRGDLVAVRAILADVLAALIAADEDCSSSSVVQPMWRLGSLAYAVGDLPSAREAWSRTRTFAERAFPETHPFLLSVQNNVAIALNDLGDLEGARAQFEHVIAVRESFQGEDHPDLIRARANLSLLVKTIGDLPAARVLEEAVLAAFERTMPDDSPDLLKARINLASTYRDLGELEAALDLGRQAVDIGRRSMGADDLLLLRAEGNLALALRDLGRISEACVLEEHVLEARTRLLPGDHPDLVLARLNLASTLSVAGDLSRARALEEDVLRIRERLLPPDHPDLLVARGNLAATLFAMGDTPAARALQEQVVAGYERVLGAGHPRMLVVQSNLAAMLSQAGDLVAARLLQARVLAAQEQILPEGHPDLLLTRGNLAHTLRQLGRHEAARALEERVLEGYEALRPRDHSDIQDARVNLAATLCEMGEDRDAVALLELAIAAFERTLPRGDSAALAARYNLTMLHSLVDLDAAREQLGLLVAGMSQRLTGCLLLSRRQAREIAATERNRLTGALFTAELLQSSSERDSDSGSDPAFDLRERIFDLIELCRLVTSERSAVESSLASDPDLARLAGEAAEVRSQLNDLIAGPAREGERSGTLESTLTGLATRRDDLERELRARLQELGALAPEIRARDLAAGLPHGSLFVGFLRSEGRRDDPETPIHWSEEGVLIAHVLHPDGRLERLDLGPAAEIEALVGKWRGAIGKSVSGRGIAVADAAAGADAESVQSIGRILRARLVDPLLASAMETTTIFVCPDDVLHLVPLDALPWGDEPMSDERVGDRIEIRVEINCARLLAQVDFEPGAPAFLGIGGVDYGSAVEASAQLGDRSGAVPLAFATLPETLPEVRSIGELFAEAFAIEPTLLTASQATRDAFRARSSGVRFVHVATHGWFAPETVKSTEDVQPESQRFATMSVEERVTGFAPMTLCGLALAGANGGRDSLGRLPGILTAEELCSLDLSQCELAVLSACETNVGIRRAGQGIQSLQAALYAAGARTSITSLWKVDDAATRRLMEVFYSNLWLEEMPKAEALWAAKKTLREEGHPPRDWAGWVMTGNPD